MDDIAALAGVSKPTVSRALQDSPLVNAKTKQHVLDVAERYGYAVNRNAQNLRRQRNDTIALVLDYSSLPDQRLTDPFHFQLLANVANALAARNLDLLLCSPQRSKYQTLMTSKSADGLLLVGQGGREDMLRRLAKSRVPFVVWGASDAAGGYCVVGSDNALGGRLAARRFLDLRRSRPAFLGPIGHPEIIARRAGFVEELARMDSALGVRDITVADLSYDAGFAATRAALSGASPIPDALFCASDTLAIAAIAALREAGVEVPAACSIIGFDDGPSAVLHVPPLTTIRQDTRMAGAVWVETLMQVMDGAPPRTVLIPVELVVRGT